jgi:hypothetical protein
MHGNKINRLLVEGHTVIDRVDGVVCCQLPVENEKKHIFKNNVPRDQTAG